jgi:hypothetical protein
MHGESQITLGMILGDIAFILGAFAITGTLTRISNYYLKKKLIFKKAAIISFIIVGVFITIILNFTVDYPFGLRRAFIIYIPCLVFWLIRDIMKSNRS